MTTNHDSVDELRAEIARLTGTEPESKNQKHLAERLAELRRPAFANVPLTKATLAALDRIVEAKMPGKRNGRPRRAELVRAALVAYARANGFVAEAALLEEASS